MTTNREESIAELAEVLTKEQLANIISHNYSDQALAKKAVTEDMQDKPRFKPGKKTRR